MEVNDPKEFTEEQEEVLKSIRVSRVIIPILIGVGVVIYLAWQQFNPEEYAQINWTSHALFWIACAVILLIIRHIAYALRLYILSEKAFSFSKCIELIFIWEFSSAVSSTSIGGSAVALFILSQEKLSAAKTSAIVLYTIVLDTFFFIFTLLILFLILGPIMIRPNLTSLDGWGYTFITTYIFMAIYGFFFFYALFIKPEHVKGLINRITNLKLLKKYKVRGLQIADDFVIASKHLRKKNFVFHCRAFGATFIAWSTRFLLLNCLIIGIVDTTSIDFFNQFKLYGRLEAMFVIMAFSPTPGGAGFAEIVFGGFLSDYVPAGIAFIVASIWRLLTYYSYLLAGVIVIPNWLRGILDRRRRIRHQNV